MQRVPCFLRSVGSWPYSVLVYRTAATVLYGRIHGIALCTVVGDQIWTACWIIAGLWS